MILRFRNFEDELLENNEGVEELDDMINDEEITDEND